MNEKVKKSTLKFFQNCFNGKSPYTEVKWLTVLAYWDENKHAPLINTPIKGSLTQ